MHITSIQRNRHSPLQYLATFHGLYAYGYTRTEAIINLLTIL